VIRNRRKACCRRKETKKVTNHISEEKDEEDRKKTSLEPKYCFGHNKSRKTQNQRKFKGYAHSEDDYKFSENAN